MKKKKISALFLVIAALIVMCAISVLPAKAATNTKGATNDKKESADYEEALEALADGIVIRDRILKRGGSIQEAFAAEYQLIAEYEGMTFELGEELDYLANLCIFSLKQIADYSDLDTEKQEALSTVLDSEVALYTSTISTLEELYDKEIDSYEPDTKTGQKTDKDIKEAERTANGVKDSMQFGKTEAKEERSDKGSITDPFSISDVISFRGYDAIGYNYATGVRSVDTYADIEISNIKFEGTKFSFDYKIVDSDTNEPKDIMDYISAGYITTSGQATPSVMIWDKNQNSIHLIKNHSIRAYADYLDEEVGPEMFTFQFYQEDGESVTYYVKAE